MHENNNYNKTSLCLFFHKEKNTFYYKKESWFCFKKQWKSSTKETIININQYKNQKFVLVVTGVGGGGGGSKY